MPPQLSPVHRLVGTVLDCKVVDRSVILVAWPFRVLVGTEDRRLSDFYLHDATVAVSAVPPPPPPSQRAPAARGCRRRTTMMTLRRLEEPRRPSGTGQQNPILFPMDTVSVSGLCATAAAPSTADTNFSLRRRRHVGRVAVIPHSDVGGVPARRQMKEEQQEQEQWQQHHHPYRRQQRPGHVPMLPPPPQRRRRRRRRLETQRPRRRPRSIRFRRPEWKSMIGEGERWVSPSSHFVLGGAQPSRARKWPAFRGNDGEEMCDCGRGYKYTADGCRNYFCSEGSFTSSDGFVAVDCELLR